MMTPTKSSVCQKTLPLLVLLLLLFISNRDVMAQDGTIIHLWLDSVPGETAARHPAVVTDNHSNNVTRLKDVTDPVMTVFLRKEEKATGAAVLICPGGGYKILAINLEGYEIAHWLNKQGIAAFVLQYRVPDKQKGALQDAQRAMRIIRKNANKWQ